MNIASAKDLKIIHGLPPQSKKGDRVALDSEFFGQEKKKLHRPHGRFAFLGASYDGVTVYYITDEDEIQEFYNRLDKATHIYHNAKYDIRQLRRFATIPERRLLWDTMLIEQIQYSGYYTDFSLADLVRRYLDTYMSKEVRKEFSDDTVSEIDKEQIEYSCIDVAYTWRVFQVQREKICDDDLSIWKDIELPFLWTLLSMSGIRLDVEKWSALAKKNEKIAKDIQDKYGCWEEVETERQATVILKDEDDEVGTLIPYRKTKKPKFSGINLNSPAQVKAHFSQLGLALKSTDAYNLEKIIASGPDDNEDAFNFANDLSTYRTYSKRASTYGESFITDYVEEDGKVYADIFQIGAETGRTSCRAPNLQNQPHLPEYRECFVVDEDEVMIVADWGSQEPRIAAYLSGDEGLKDALNSDEKLYVIVARESLHINITKNDPEYKHMKSTILGIFYGMSAYGLSQAIGEDEETCQGYIDSILETYPGVKEYMRKQKRAKDYVVSIYGRKIWLNKYSFQWERNALNAPIQGSAADAMKIAARRFVDNWMFDMGAYEEGETPVFSGSPTPLTLLVHDEIVIKVPKPLKEQAMKVLERAMISVAEEMHDGIKGSIEIFPGFNWACKH